MKLQKFDLDHYISLWWIRSADSTYRFDVGSVYSTVNDYYNCRITENILTCIII